VSECVCVSECVFVCVRERGTVCVKEREREGVCLTVRESVCVKVLCCVAMHHLSIKRFVPPDRGYIFVCRLQIIFHKLYLFFKK